MSDEIKVIETAYKGYRFRSRLEARWAVFLDALGVKWEYEKEGYSLGAAGQYLPDFWLPEYGFWLEIKGEAKREDLDKERVLALVGGAPVCVAVGQVGDEHWINFGDTDQSGQSRFSYSVAREDGTATWLENMLSVYQKYQHGEFPAKESLNAWGATLLCPVCGGERLRYGNPVVRATGENHNSRQGNGDAICIPVQCEDGHSLLFCLGRRDDGLVLAIEGVIDTQTGDVGGWLAGGDRARYRQAVNAARSARFEHGEMPG